MGVDVMRIETENVVQNNTDQEFILWLYQEFYRLMFYTAQKYVADKKQQEDIVQESLRKLIEKTPRLRRFQRSVLASYIVSTVRNTAIDYLKMWQEEKDRMVDLDTLNTQALITSQSMDETLIFQEKMELLKKVWPKLDAETRMVLEGKYILGYDDKKISQLLDCQPSSVRMRLTRARRKALELMRKEGKGYDKP